MKKLFESEKIIETDHFDVYQDWEVPIPAFFIVAVKRKIRSVADFTPEEAQEFISLVRRVREGMKKVLGIEDVYLFQNEDTEHSFHLWMFPRHQWMDRFGRKIESVRPIMRYAQEQMVTDDVIREVQLVVKKMKNYLAVK